MVRIVAHRRYAMSNDAELSTGTRNTSRNIQFTPTLGNDERTKKRLIVPESPPRRRREKKRKRKQAKAKKRREREVKETSPPTNCSTFILSRLFTWVAARTQVPVMPEGRELLEAKVVAEPRPLTKVFVSGTATEGEDADPIVTARISQPVPAIPLLNLPRVIAPPRRIARSDSTLLHSHSSSDW